MYSKLFLIIFFNFMIISVDSSFYKNLWCFNGKSPVLDDQKRSDLKHKRSVDKPIRFDDKPIYDDDGNDKSQNQDLLQLVNQNNDISNEGSKHNSLEKTTIDTSVIDTKNRALERGKTVVNEETIKSISPGSEKIDQTDADGVNLESITSGSPEKTEQTDADGVNLESISSNSPEKNDKTANANSDELEKPNQVKFDDVNDSDGDYLDIASFITTFPEPNENTNIEAIDNNEVEDTKYKEKTKSKINSDEKFGGSEMRDIGEKGSSEETEKTKSRINSDEKFGGSEMVETNRRDIGEKGSSEETDLLALIGKGSSEETEKTKSRINSDEKFGGSEMVETNRRDIGEKGSSEETDLLALIGKGSSEETEKTKSRINSDEKFGGSEMRDIGGKGSSEETDLLALIGKGRSEETEKTKSRINSDEKFGGSEMVETNREKTKSTISSDEKFGGSEMRDIGGKGNSEETDLLALIGKGNFK